MNPGRRFFGPYNGPYPGPYPVRGHDLWWLHDLFALLIVVAIVVGVVLIVRHFVSRPRFPSRGWPPSPAVHELDLRYARGEIERDEYMRRRGDILQHPGGWAPPPPPPPGPPPPPKPAA